MIEKREPLKSIPYGMSCEGAVLLPVTAENPFMRIRLDTGEEVDTKLVGAYNADNVMAALAVGKLFFIDTRLHMMQSGITCLQTTVLSL